MIADDELHEHLIDSLYHLEFLREFMRRTGFVEEIGELGWVYGRDWNGGWGDDIYDAQLGTMLQLLAPNLSGSVTVTSFEDDMWTTCESIDGRHDREEVMFEVAFVITIMGNNVREVEGWRQFLWWQECRGLQGNTGANPGTFMFRNNAIEQPNFLWVVPEAGIEDILDIWNKIVGAWEVMEYYGHFAAEREGQGSGRTIGSDDGTGRTSTTINNGERCDSLQDSEFGSTSQPA